MLASGALLSEIKNDLGHEDIQSTTVYLHLDLTRRKYYWVHKIDCILVVYFKNSSSAFADNLCQTGLTGSS